MLLGHVVAAADLADFFPGHPGAIAHPLTGALYFLRDHQAGAIVRRASARVERPAAGQPAAARGDRAGAVTPFFAPLARADFDCLLRPDRLAGIRLANHLLGFLHGAVASDRHLADVLFVHRPIGAPADRHLVLLPHRLADRVAALADVLLVHRPIGAPADRHLILFPDRLADRVAALADVLLVHRPIGAPADRHLVLFPDRLADRVAALADMLFVHRLANRVLTDDLVILPDRLADRVAALANVLLIHRLADRRAALLHDGLIDRTIANPGLVLDDRLVANSVTNLRQARLLRAATPCRVVTSPAVPRPGRRVHRPQLDERDSQGQLRQLEPHLWPPRSVIPVPQRVEGGHNLAARSIDQRKCARFSRSGKEIMKQKPGVFLRRCRIRGNRAQARSFWIGWNGMEIAFKRKRRL